MFRLDWFCFYLIFGCHICGVGYPSGVNYYRCCCYLIKINIISFSRVLVTYFNEDEIFRKPSLAKVHLDVLIGQIVNYIYKKGIVAQLDVLIE